MKEKRVKYPIGEQSFEQLRKDGYLYVDKTQYIDRLVNGSKYYFLARPRRFGKSLFLSTLKCFFEGKRYLFTGLHADSMDWNWESYPVIYLDLNNRRYKEDFKLEMLLNDFLEENEKKFGIDIPSQPTDFSGRFRRLIKGAAESSGKNVVILVDEYDKPLVNNIHEKPRFKDYRGQLAELYSNFKSSADYIRMVFLTGVSRFGKLSVFSDLNNLSDITFDHAFAGICGITEEELLRDFSEGLNEISTFYSLTPAQTTEELKRRYDGYHFSRFSPDLYNPFSLLNVFDKCAFDNYWIASGTPSLLLEQLKRTHTDLAKLMEAKSSLSQLAGLDIDNLRPIALLFQTGYLTIKSYESKGDICRLGIPNDEVKEGFLEFLLPAYANLHDEDSKVFVFEITEDFEKGNVEKAMLRLKSLFSSTSYEMEMHEEKNVQNALFILFKLIGLKVDAEYKTSDGRIDILLRTQMYVYIIELKFDHTAEEALQQIERKEYALPWAVENREIIGIGINFSKEKRTIASWISKPL